MKPGPRSLRSDGVPRSAALRRMARARAIGVVGALALAIAVPLACASETSLSGPGQECFAATDCADGLVCVPQRDGTRLCSDDLSQVAGRPPPEGGAAAEAGGDGPREANPGDVQQGQDTSMPDTSMPDTSTPVDAGGEAG